MTDETPKLPIIHVEFVALGSADMKIRVENCSPPQIWATAHMLELFADDMYRAQQAMQAQSVTGSQLAVARSIPQDHMGKLGKPRNRQ